jgi:hypothetical protein
MWNVEFERLKSVQILTISPWDSNPCPTHQWLYIAAQHLNVRQRKLGTIIIQTVHILQHDSAVAGSLPKRNLSMAIGQLKLLPVRHVTGNDKDYLRKIPRVVW